MIEEVKGDATQPDPASGYLVHVCNNIGLWGGGFTGALSRRWPEPERAYREAADEPGLQPGDWLGSCQFVELATPKGLVVVNMVAQRGVRGPNNPKPLRLIPLAICLDTVLDRMTREGATWLHMPRIGCGLAGGNWDTEVLPLLESCLVERPTINVKVYNL